MKFPFCHNVSMICVAKCKSSEGYNKLLDFSVLECKKKEIQLGHFSFGGGGGVDRLSANLVNFSGGTKLGNFGI